MRCGKSFLHAPPKPPPGPPELNVWAPALAAEMEKNDFYAD